MCDDFIRKIDLNDYNYALPEERIAQYPVSERDESNMLVYTGGNISKDKFKNIAGYLPGDSMLVFNNTRVIRARIIFHKDTGAEIEVFCLDPLLPRDYAQSFSSMESVEWKCIIGNLKKWKRGRLIREFELGGKTYKLSAQRTGTEGEAWRIRFTWDAPEISFGEVMETAGNIPLPPYVKRKDEEGDYIRYQTVYASIRGSVAAPTAGLHFTRKVLDSIYNKGIRSAELTLHVGAGTFQPVRTKNLINHKMHTEHFFITETVLKELRSFTGKLIAVGTTSVRCLESLYWLGVKEISGPSGHNCVPSVGQWEPYTLPQDIPLIESITAVQNLTKRLHSVILPASTAFMILPGYRFRMINGMITNFHQPKSTLLLLISALVGSDWKRIYRFALENDFRFLSYGDTSLLI